MKNSRRNIGNGTNNVGKMFFVASVLNPVTYLIIYPAVGSLSGFFKKIS